MLVRSETFRKAKAAAAGAITVGTTGIVTPYLSGNAETHTFTTGLTLDGGGASLVLVIPFVVAFGVKDNNWDAAPAVLTLNGVSSDTMLARYIQNTGSNKYCQAYVALWNSPSAGDIVVDWPSNWQATSSGCYFLNLSGLAASPLGAVSREHFTTGTTLAWQITTTGSNSLVLYINGSRTNVNTSQDFTPTDGSITQLALQAGSGIDGRGAWRVGYRNGLAANTYDGGGAWTESDPDRIAGMGVELLAA